MRTMKTRPRRPAALAVAAAASTTLTLWPAGPARGYQTFNSHRLTYGVSGQRFWLDATAVAANSPGIYNATALWNATASPISYTETTVKAQSRLDFYHPAHPESAGLCGYTEWFVDTTEIDPAVQNWWWAKVSLTNNLTDIDKCGPGIHRKAIVAHEQGHAMGLAHAVRSDRLMYTWIATTTVNDPQPDDIAGINYLY